MLLLSRNYVFRVDPSRSDYSQLFWTCRASMISDLPINLRISHKRVSPLLPTHLLVGELLHRTKYKRFNRNFPRRLCSNRRCPFKPHKNQLDLIILNHIDFNANIYLYKRFEPAAGETSLLICPFYWTPSDRV